MYTGTSVLFFCFLAGKRYNCSYLSTYAACVEHSGFAYTKKRNIKRAVCVVIKKEEKKHSKSEEWAVAVTLKVKEQNSDIKHYSEN